MGASRTTALTAAAGSPPALDACNESAGKTRPPALRNARTSAAAAI